MGPFCYNTPYNDKGMKAMFILGNTEMGLYLVSDDEFLIPYMSNIKKDAKQFKRRVEALEFIEEFEKMGLHADYIHVLRMNKE